MHKITTKILNEDVYSNSTFNDDVTLEVFDEFIMDLEDSLNALHDGNGESDLVDLEDNFIEVELVNGEIAELDIDEAQSLYHELMMYGPGRRIIYKDMLTNSAMFFHYLDVITDNVKDQKPDDYSLDPDTLSDVDLQRSGY